MAGYRLYTRIVHALTAGHWRGYAVHSPMMYGFIRKIVMPNRRRDLIDAIRQEYGSENVAMVDRVDELNGLSDGKTSVVVLRKPFVSIREKWEFELWYTMNHVVVAQLQGIIVLFFDSKLPKQYFKIRN